MALRIRVVDNKTVALCAACYPAEPGDVYLDDRIHAAITEKYLDAWTESGLIRPNKEPIMDAVNVDTITQTEREALGLPPVTTYIGETQQPLTWQTGPIPEGRNGVTLEEVIEACIDRLNGFNQTQFRCRENSLAITALEEARNWLLQRTRGRVARGVEGTLEV